MERLHIERKEKIKISKLHLLIHPGYLTDDEYRQNYTGYDQYLEQFKELMDRYVAQAKKIGPDELFIVFTHTEKEDFRKHLKDDYFYVQKIKEMKGILGKRMITINMGVRDLTEKDTDAIKKIANARGYDFDDTVLSDAYGELLCNCVIKGAKDFNESAKLTHKTVLRPELSELDITKFPSKNECNLEDECQHPSYRGYVSIEFPDKKK